MSKAKSPAKINAQIYEEASDWIIKHRDGELDEAEKQVFDAWLRTSPEHVRAYLEMSSVWEDVSSLDPKWNSSTSELVARGRLADNVFPFDAGSGGKGTSAGARPSTVPAADGARRFFRSLLAASIVIACLGAGVFAWMHRDPDYSTGIGEQRSITLADGSTVELNARSRIKIRFSEYERDIDLLEGQAIFRVAKDVRRPFVVRSETTVVRAVGTQFDVYRRRSGGTTVTVVEGRVSVSGTTALAGPARPENHGNSGTPPDRSGGALPLTIEPGAVFVSAGEQLTVMPTAVAQPTPANIDTAIAWTQHRLVFDSAPLSDVAEEFNRYNTRQLIIDDPRLASFHVSGVFSSVDPSLLLSFLRAQSQISIQETDREIRISRK